MLQIQISGLKEAIAKMDDIGRRLVPSAMKSALNATAFDIQKAERMEMQQVLDRPTPYTIRSVVVEAADLKDGKKGGIMTAAVGISDPSQAVGDFINGKFKARSGAENWTASPSLIPQVYGGGRDFKPSEKWLRSAGILPEGMYIAPARSAWLDQYGNISGPIMVQILSSVKAFGERGYLMNKTGKSRGKKKNSYFVMKRDGRPIGIAEYMGPGNAVPVLMFVHAPHYQPRFNFHSVAQAIYFSSFMKNFKDAMAQFRLSR